MLISVQYTTSSSGWNNGFMVPKGLVLHSTAWPGMNAQAIRDYFNAPNRGASIHAAVDDKMVVQCFPWDKIAGHVGGGSNGSLNYSHIGVELCEPKGLVYNGNGSTIVSYNPDPAYFPLVWKNAVELFAMLCERYSLDPLKKGVIVSHAEAHQMGVGSNHADPAHWFIWEGVTMDDFREAVYKKINEEEEEVTYEQWKEFMDRYMNEAVDDTPSSWAVAACEKAIELGILQGNGKGDYSFRRPLTRESYFVFQDRQGLL